MTTTDASSKPLATLSASERIALIYRIRVWYPRMKAIYDEIVRAYEMNPLTPDPECVAVFGRFRTGKSTLVDSFCSQHPRVIGDEMTHVPVLKVVVPAKASMSNMLTNLLVALGDPLAEKGNMGVKYHRLERLLTDCEVRMLVVDEASHFVDRDSQRVLHDVSNTLKNLVKTHNLACVLVGLPYTEEVLRVNEQFGSLFGDAYVLEPFQWNEAQPETVVEFRTFLHLVEQQLPLEVRNGLVSKEMAWRCFVATQGKVGYLMRLLRRSAEEAVRRGLPGLTQELLSDTFTTTLAGKRRNMVNPFNAHLPEAVEAQENEYWPVRRQRSG